MPLLVALQPVDVGIDGSIAPVKEQFGLCQLRKRLVGIRVVHTVVFFFRAVPHRIVYEVATLLAVGPLVVAVPHNLWCPHTIDGRPVLVDTFCRRVAEDGRTLTIVEGLRRPVYQVVAHQQVDAIVVPLCLLLQVLESANVHVRAHHQIAASVVFPTDEGIARSALDTGMFVVAEDGVAVQQVVVVETVAAQCVGCPCPSAVVHVAVQVTIVTLLQVAFFLLRHHVGRHQPANQCQQ